MNGVIIVDQPRSGVWNMAIDRALAEYARIHALCIMRLYLWESPTLSLGYFQPYPTPSLQGNLSKLDVVRRETGGGAIVHDHDVTYSIVMPDQSEKGHATQLIVWLTSLGVMADFYSNRIQTSCDNTCNNDRYLCFERRSDFDIVVAGHKVLGSAQRRHAGVIMQHGSLLVRRSEFAPSLMGLVEAASTETKASGISGEIPPVSSWQPIQLQNAMAETLSGKLGQDFGILWSRNSLENLVRPESLNRFVDQFQSFEWSHRV
jgi:lipoyl(octanoyl) transferase